ncbi:HAD family hydrolase [Gimesia sp.]|uniref:HAD family hydrolase n=1 Tax=Gimesia sp. TaxID=2024833 RepID=UPI003A9325EB
MTGIIFDLDQTLVDSSIAEELRASRRWPEVYKLIPQMLVYPGVLEILAMLTDREVPLAVVTSSPKPYCSKVLEHHKISIVNKVCFHDTKRRKPFPDPILKAIDDLGVPTNTIWSIGDLPKDIEASKAASVSTVGVTWGLTDPTELIESDPDHLFDTVAELHHFLDELTI